MPLETHAAPQAGLRSGTVDWLRFVALFEIAGVHSPPGERIPFLAGLGLPLLLLITNMYNVVNAERYGAAPFVRIKVRRLLAPWVFWCGVFGALVIASAIAGDIPLTRVFSLRHLIGGTWPHLWFVPFAIFAGLATAALHRATRRLPTAPTIAAASLAGLALVAAGAQSNDFLWAQVGPPAPQWAFSFASIGFGLGLGRVLLLGDARSQRGALATLAIAGAMLWAVAAGLDAPWPYERYGGAAFILVAGLLLSYPADRAASLLAPLTLGVYLAHPFIIRLLGLAKLSLPHSTAWAAVSVSLAIVLVYAMRRSPLRRFV